MASRDEHAAVLDFPVRPSGAEALDVVRMRPIRTRTVLVHIWALEFALDQLGESGDIDLLTDLELALEDARSALHGT